MKQQAVVAEQFGNTASAYLTSAVHAQGEDLKAIQNVVRAHGAPKVLDLGCGAGHVSFAVSAFSATVTAYDLSPQMLSVVALAAKERQLPNIETHQGLAEKLPFNDAEFDIVITRFSAHHWLDVPMALKEIHRVLKPQGTVLISDITAPENPLHDTTLQAVELLRDASHVRDYRISEWQRMLREINMTADIVGQWKLVMKFDEWTARMQTPAVRIQAIRSLFQSAPEETHKYFDVQPDCSFSIDATLIESRKESRNK